MQTCQLQMLLLDDKKLEILYILRLLLANTNSGKKRLTVSQMRNKLAMSVFQQ